MLLQSFGFVWSFQLLEPSHLLLNWKQTPNSHLLIQFFRPYLYTLLRAHKDLFQPWSSVSVTYCAPHGDVVHWTTVPWSVWYTPASFQAYSSLCPKLLLLWTPVPISVLSKPCSSWAGSCLLPRGVRFTTSFKSILVRNPYLSDLIRSWLTVRDPLLLASDLTLAHEVVVMSLVLVLSCYAICYLLYLIFTATYTNWYWLTKLVSRVSFRFFSAMLPITSDFRRYSYKWFLAPDGGVTALFLVLFITGSFISPIFIALRAVTYCTEIRFLAQFYIRPRLLALYSVYLLRPRLHTYCIGFSPLFIHFDNGSQSWWFFPGQVCPLLIFILFICAQRNVHSTRFLGLDRFTASISPLFLHASWDA